MDKWGKYLRYSKTTSEPSPDAEQYKFFQQTTAMINNNPGD